MHPLVLVFSQKANKLFRRPITAKSAMNDIAVFDLAL